MSSSLPTLLTQSSQSVLERLKAHPSNILSTNKLGDRLNEALALSSFVAESCEQEPQLLRFLNDAILASVAVNYQQELAEQLANIEDETELFGKIRHFRRKHMCAIAVRDLLNLQTIQDSLIQTSELADQLVFQTYEWLYRTACNKYGTPECNHQPMPLLILAMGKLGGQELNFSSDIDLIFTYPAQGQTKGARKSIEHQQFFTRLAQSLIQALNKITIRGRVFRVDMRLRPFGDSGPLVMPFSAFEDYYQEQGREWERYAMIKARILGPKTAFSNELRQMLTSFVYRRYVDFSAVESLRKMKQLINQEIKRRKLEQNIKLGKGGIREIEFIVQSFQLIRGGREPSLQTQSLLQSLTKLSELNLMAPDKAAQLEQAYLFLRKVEHCLQQFNDEQIQTLPADALNQTRLCWVMCQPAYAEFLQRLQQHQAFVSALFNSLVGETQEEAIFQQEHVRKFTDIWMLQHEQEEISALLQNWLDKSHVSAFITELQHLRQFSIKRAGERGRQALDQLMPKLLQQALESSDALVLLQRSGKVINAIAGRTAYLELMNQNQAVTNRLLHLCVASPWIAEQLAHFPILLDELIDPRHLYSPSTKQAYADELRQRLLRIDPLDLELQMETLREFKLAHQLRIAVADITGNLPTMRVSDQLTFLAEAIITQVVRLAWQQMADRFGEPENTDIDSNGLAVVGYGKLGGLELGYGSDLDLVFLHNGSVQQMTQGRKCIDARRFYTKLVQRIMHLFSTKTRSGVLYAVDLRLRPSGGAGLLVNHVQGFAEYQLHDAWTWEHQALVRARIIDAPANLHAEFADIRQKILAIKRQKAQLAHDVVNMREKMQQHLSAGNKNNFDLKRDTGGIADIEFLVQFWVLAHTQSYPALARWSDNMRILEDLKQCNVIEPETANTLQQIYLNYRQTGHRLTLQQRTEVDATSKFTRERKQVIAIWRQALATGT